MRLVVSLKTNIVLIVLGDHYALNMRVGPHTDGPRCVLAASGDASAPDESV